MCSAQVVRPLKLARPSCSRERQAVFQWVFSACISKLFSLFAAKLNRLTTRENNLYFPGLYIGFFPWAEGAVLKVQVADIPEEGLRVDVDDFSWFPDREFGRRDDFQASIFFSGLAGRVMITGSMSMSIVLECDRCLKEFEFPKKIDFQLAVEQEEDPSLALADHEVDRNEMDVIFLTEPVIDIDDILYQQVVLALPQKSLCRSKCRGVCGRCGADLNREDCRCRMDDGGSPFSVLGQLLKEKK